VIEIATLRGADADTAWDEFLLGSPGGLIYHSTRYRDLLVDHLGCEAEYLMALEGGEIRGVMPLMWSGEAGARVCNSLPFYGSHGGPIAAQPEAEARLIDAWNERAADTGTLAATMVANPFLDHDPPVPEQGITEERISQATPLPAGAGEEEILALVDSSARRNVRKADRLGVEVAIDPDALADLHRLHAENMEAIGGRAKQASFFEAIPAHLRAGEEFDLWVARLDGDVISALLVLHFNGVSEYFTPATAHEHRSDQPLAAILVRAMSDSARRGRRLWNWGGTWGTQDGVYRFKRKWGAVDRRYLYFIQLNDRALLESSPEELLERFPHFYVVPFSALQPTGGIR
jgi:hypothetical protein